MGGIQLTADALLLDMDGTLIDSTAHTNATWTSFAVAHKLDIKHVLSTCHGRRTLDNMKVYLGQGDEERDWDALVTEFDGYADGPANGRASGIEALPGAKALVDTLEQAAEDNHIRWAIVTSATRQEANRGLRLSRLQPRHALLVTADDCARGKPDPEPYLLAAQRLGVDIAKCVAIEDSPTGIQSARRSGAKVIAVLTSHSNEEVEACKPDMIVQDLRKLHVSVTGEHQSLTLLVEGEAC